MIRVLIGNIFESKAQTLVNTVNCVGVMGQGIALEFKKQFPDMYEDYLRRCKAGRVKLGQPYLFPRTTVPWILNFPTKDHWRSVSRLDDIIRGMEYLECHCRKWGITSLAVPPLGCGAGQLEWRVVGSTLYRYLNRLEAAVELYAPFGTPHEELQVEFLEHPRVTTWAKPLPPPPSRIDPAWVALVEILSRVEQEPYHWPVGRTTFQKIAYFATEAGIPTRLQYNRASFGPFAPKLKARITQLVNNGLIREERLGRMHAVKVGPTFSDARRAYKEEFHKWEGIIERVADLFVRMRTREAELAATVHFASQSLGKQWGNKPTEKEVLAEVMKWKQKRRPPLNEAEVALTIRNLGLLDWLDVKPSRDLPVPEEALLGAAAG
jgi:O-acetyl-ADP-ribose deacetylase (regulator of RNase III)/uncharacterized protein YwgA